MVYDTNGLFPTLCACTHGYAMGNIIEYFDKEAFEDMNKIIKLGNIYPKQGQAGVVLDTEGICPTLVTFTGGGGKQPIIKENHETVARVRQQIKSKGEINMWKNELTKYDFLMEEVKVFDVFAGIGALHQSLKDLGVPTKITSLSEIDIDATISYAASHIDNFKDIEFEYPSDDEMKKWISDNNVEILTQYPVPEDA